MVITGCIYCRSRLGVGVLSERVCGHLLRVIQGELSWIIDVACETVVCGCILWLINVYVALVKREMTVVNDSLRHGSGRKSVGELM